MTWQSAERPTELRTGQGGEGCWLNGPFDGVRALSNDRFRQVNALRYITLLQNINKHSNVCYLSESWFFASG